MTGLLFAGMAEVEEETETTEAAKKERAAFPKSTFSEGRPAMERSVAGRVGATGAGAKAVAPDASARAATVWSWNFILDFVFA